MLEEELILFSFVKGGVRVGEARGGGLHLFLGGSEIKFGRSQFLKSFSCFFTIIIILHGGAKM